MGAITSHSRLSTHVHRSGGRSGALETDVRLAAAEYRGEYRPAWVREHIIDRRSTVTVSLPNGVPLLVETMGDRKSGNITGRDHVDLKAVRDSIVGLAALAHEALETAVPDEAEIQFNLAMTAETGKLLCLLVSGSAQASITVTLRWNGASETALPVT